VGVFAPLAGANLVFQSQWLDWHGFVVYSFWIFNNE
jgi:hypothetical protein